eukprot:2624856-Amphidinium_carterae.1
MQSGESDHHGLGIELRERSHKSRMAHEFQTLRGTLRSKSHWHLTEGCLQLMAPQAPFSPARRMLVGHPGAQPEHRQDAHATTERLRTRAGVATSNDVGGANDTLVERRATQTIGGQRPATHNANDLLGTPSNHEMDHANGPGDLEELFLEDPLEAERIDRLPHPPRPAPRQGLPHMTQSRTAKCSLSC